MPTSLAWLSLTALICACGAAPPEPERPADVWVTQVDSTVQVGCRCTEAACVEGARHELEAIVLDHGGFDEAPTSVHVARERLETCARENVPDPYRDLHAIAEQVCACGQVPLCPALAMPQLRAFETRYGPASQIEDLRVQQEWARLRECAPGQALTEADLAVRVESLADQLCACGADAECTTTVSTAFLSAALPSIVARIGESPLSSRITAAMHRACECIPEEELVSVPQRAELRSVLIRNRSCP